MTHMDESWRLPLVFLPGFMQDLRVWERQIRSLSRFATVIGLPLGNGLCLETNMRSALEHLPERFVLFGTGLGSCAAVELLRQAPERVAGICMVAGSALSERPEQAAQREPLIVRAQAGQLRQVMRDILPPEALAPGALVDLHLEQVSKMALTLGPEVFVRQSRMLQRRADRQDVLRKASLPALILVGAHDPITPVKRQEVTATLMPNARLAVIKRAGHLPTLEAPEETALLIQDWLQSVQSELEAQRGEKKSLNWQALRYGLAAARARKGGAPGRPAMADLAVRSAPVWQLPPEMRVDRPPLS